MCDIITLHHSWLHHCTSSVYITKHSNIVSLFFLPQFRCCRHLHWVQTFFWIISSLNCEQTLPPHRLKDLVNQKSGSFFPFILHSYHLTKPTCRLNEKNFNKDLIQILSFKHLLSLFEISLLIAIPEGRSLSMFLFPWFFISLQHPTLHSSVIPDPEANTATMTAFCPPVPIISQSLCCTSVGCPYYLIQEVTVQADETLAAPVWSGAIAVKYKTHRKWRFVWRRGGDGHV